jgi:hypothetical protein
MHMFSLPSWRTHNGPHFSRRKAFEQTLIVLDQVICVFEAVGPEHPVDIDNAAQRESLDVIGRVGDLPLLYNKITACQCCSSEQCRIKTST